MLELVKRAWLACTSSVCGQTDKSYKQGSQAVHCKARKYFEIRVFGKLDLSSKISESTLKDY